MNPNIPRNEYINVNGLKLHYLDWGNSASQPMLLLHGFMGHAHVWDDFALTFRDKYHLIALDQRGHGDSEWPMEPAYSIDEHFSDIAAFVESLNLKKFILIGHSMGGRNALFFAACIPTLVERLVLVDARPMSNPVSSEALLQLISKLPLKTRSLDEVSEVVRNIYPHLPRELTNRIAKFGYKQTQGGEFIPKFDTRMASLSERFDGTAEDLWDFVGCVTCPTLIVRGEESPYLSLQDMSKMTSTIPEAVGVEISGSSHMPVQENPESFNKAIMAFLEDPYESD